MIFKGVSLCVAVSLLIAAATARAGAPAPATSAEAVPTEKLAAAHFKCVEDAFPRDKHRALPSVTSYTNGDIYAARTAFIDHDQKVTALYKAANDFDLPAAVLAGSVLQESSGADLGVGRDFGNWTCGPSQYSVLAWCEWALILNPASQKMIGWPSDLVRQFQSRYPGVNICQEDKFIAREHVKPLLAIALHRMVETLHSNKAFLMQPQYFTQPASIRFDDVKDAMTNVSKAHQSFGAGDAAIEDLRFEMTKSFAENCSNHKSAYRPMAYNLRRIFETLPIELQNAQTIKTPEGNNPLYSCQQPVRSRAYPLHVGWLLADAIYNAGPSLLPGVLDYQKHSGIPWDQFSPQDLIKAIDYAISPKFGMWGIGPEEAKSHMRGLLRTLGALPAK